MTRVIALIGQGRALETALGLGEVTALALLPPEAEAGLRAARTAGAGRAVALWDESLRDTDYYGGAQALASAIRHLGFDVVVCSDGSCGLLGPAIANRLGVPHISGVVAVEQRDGRVVASRPAAGRVHLLSAPPPLVLGVAGAPARAAAPASEGAAVTVERIGIADIGIAPGELRWRRRFARRRPEGVVPPRAAPLRLPDAGALVARLRADGLIGRPTAGEAP